MELSKSEAAWLACVEAVDTEAYEAAYEAFVAAVKAEATDAA
jgi:hypothetical protein